MLLAGGMNLFLSFFYLFSFSLFGGERRKVYLSSSGKHEEEERKLVHLSASFPLSEGRGVKERSSLT